MSTKQKFSKNYSIQLPMRYQGTYEECETIVEKIEWLEKYIQNIDNLREKFTHLSFTCEAKNDLTNGFVKEKLYKTRLKILRKQLKKKK